MTDTKAPDTKLPQRYITETQLEQLTHRDKKSWQRDRMKGTGPKFIRAGGKILYSAPRHIAGVSLKDTKSRLW